VRNLDLMNKGLRPSSKEINKLFDIDSEKLRLDE